MPRSLLLASSSLLVAAIGLVIYGSTRPQERTFYGKLLDVLPEAPAGWTRTLRPIADTPEMQKKADELLNFDDGVFVDYSRGSDRLSVYIAYWSPGRMSHRLIAGHTPDVCWVGAGWQCTERGVWSAERGVGSKTAPEDPSSTPHAPHSHLFPAESRTFTARGATEHVWFWHIVGGRPISYGPQTPPWYASLVDMLAKGLDQREEQFFIRLSAPMPLDDPAFAPVRDLILNWIATRSR